MFIPRRNLKKGNKGFTLVELLVTITIFVMLTAVVLWNQAKFNSTILLTNLAYDTALTIRQAQTYGINIKSFTANGDTDFVPYGVHFETTAGNDKSFILFADRDNVFDEATQTYRKLGDGKFDGRADTCLSDYDDDPEGLVDGCVNRYNIKRGNKIYALCAEDVLDGETECSSLATKLNKLDIVFKRPNPDAIITSGNNTITSTVTIILSGVEGDTFRKIKVGQNGLISIAK